MTGTSFLTNCPRCGYIAEAWTEDGVTARIHCKMCGYEGTLPHPDLKDPGESDKIKLTFDG